MVQLRSSAEEVMFEISISPALPGVGDWMSFPAEAVEDGEGVAEVEGEDDGGWELEGEGVGPVVKLDDGEGLPEFKLS